MTKTLPPRCGLRGWTGAWAVLERVRHDVRRELLADLARTGGMEGPGLKFLAQMLCFIAGEADYPSLPKALRPFEAEAIERRARELMNPFEGDGLFPRFRKGRR